MKCLVIGCGYVGEAFIRQGELASDQYIATTSSQKRVEELKTLTKHVEVFCHPDNKKLKELLIDADVICVFVAPKEQDYDLYRDLTGSIATLLSSSNKKRFVLYTSSTFVYESVTGAIAFESEKLLPTHPKAEILLQAENNLLVLQNEFCGVCVLRLGGIFGPGRDLSSRARYLSGRKMEGSSMAPTNHIHVEDVAGFAHFCIQNHLTGVFNVVMPEHPLRKDLYEKLCLRQGLAPPIFAEEGKAGHGCSVMVSNQKLTQSGYQLKNVKL